MRQGREYHMDVLAKWEQVYAFWVDGWTQRRIAELMGVTPTAVNQWTLRYRRWLARMAYMSRDGRFVYDPETDLWHNRQHLADEQARRDRREARRLARVLE